MLETSCRHLDLHDDKALYFVDALSRAAISAWHHLPCFPKLQKQHFPVAAIATATHVPRTSIMTRIMREHFVFRDTQTEAAVTHAASKMEAVSPTAAVATQRGSSGQADIVNMVVEIPFGTTAKMELMTTVAGNPIQQDYDAKTHPDRCPRFFARPIPLNYGSVPQTWESPDTSNAWALPYPGDGDPVDIVELGETPLRPGTVVPVRVLGCLAMIDEGELDWKILALRVEDPRTKSIRTVKDLERSIPGCIDRVRTWFRTYKCHDKHVLGQFEFGRNVLPRSVAIEVLFQAHCMWRSLINTQRDETAAGPAQTNDASKLWTPDLIVPSNVAEKNSTQS